MSFRAKLKNKNFIEFSKLFIEIPAVIPQHKNYEI